MASVPTTPTLAFNKKGFPRLYVNGFEYVPPCKPSSFGQLWYCAEYNRKDCQSKLSTSIPLYKLEVENEFCPQPHKHPEADIPSSTQCTWILYKYDFSNLQSPESIEKRLAIKGEVSSILEMQQLLGMNNMNDDDPAPLGRFQYCFFRKDITPDWRVGLNNQFGSKFILTFRKPSEVTRESLYSCWRALLTCIMQGTFGTFTEDINGAKVHFFGNAYDNSPLPPYISVWTSKDFTPWLAGFYAFPPILGEMLRKLFEPLVDVQCLKHDQN